MSEDDVVITETKRQTVILVFTLVGTVAIMYISTLRTEADVDRLVMRTALRVKRFAFWQADMWEGVALKAATVYHKRRPQP